MQLWLQFGYGMMAHCRDLHAEWRDACVILSPRDLEPNQLASLRDDLLEKDASVFIDPQFYLPHATHERLISHDYWPKPYNTGEFWKGQQLEDLVRGVVELSAECDGLIVPGLIAPRIEQGWIDNTRRVFDTRAYAGTAGEFRYATVALESGALRNDDELHSLLEEIEQWPVEGVYLVAEHPNGDYLVDDAMWLGNILDLVAGIRLSGKDVVIGYASHQMLLAASAGATAIAAGTWLNTRSGFESGRYVLEEGEIAQRALWYYCPQALSEYKMTFLDVAQRMGVLGSMVPPAGFDVSSCAMLFGGGSPSASGFSERDSFRHYLKSLREQSRRATQATFEETITFHNARLDEADALRNELMKKAVLGQKRAFIQGCTDAQRAALTMLQGMRGPILKRSWGKIAG